MRALSGNGVVIGVALALLALCPAAALADDGPPYMMEFFVIGGLLAMAVYLVPIVAVEAGVLNAILKIGYRRSVGYATVANIASTAFGLICRLVGHEEGWKTALMSGHTGHVAVLLVRSFLVTVALEGAILLALLRHRKDPIETLKAAVAANAASYALIAGILSLLHASS